MPINELAPYLNDAPVYDALLDDLKGSSSGYSHAHKTGNLNDAWQNWFNDIVSTTGFCITYDVIVDALSGQKTDIPILRATGGTTADRNALQNSRDGSVWYNTDTNQFNFRQGGAWVTFAPVPA